MALAAVEIASNIEKPFRNPYWFEESASAVAIDSSSLAATTFSKTLPVVSIREIGVQAPGGLPDLYRSTACPEALPSVGKRSLSLKHLLNKSMVSFRCMDQSSLVALFGV